MLTAPQRTRPGQEIHLIQRETDELARGVTDVGGIHEDDPLVPLHEVDNTQPLRAPIDNIYSARELACSQEFDYAHPNTVIASQRVTQANDGSHRTSIGHKAAARLDNRLKPQGSLPIRQALNKRHVEQVCRTRDARIICSH